MLTRGAALHRTRPMAAIILTPSSRVQCVLKQLDALLFKSKEYTQSRALKKPPIKKLCTAFCPNKLKNLAQSTQATNHTLNELNSVCEGAASPENFAACRVQTAVLLETSAALIGQRQGS